MMITSKAAAKLLGVGQSRVRQFVLEGRLPAKKFAGRLAIDKEDVLAFIASRKGKKNG